MGKAKRAHHGVSLRTPTQTRMDRRFRCPCWGSFLTPTYALGTSAGSSVTRAGALGTGSRTSGTSAGISGTRFQAPGNGAEAWGLFQCPARRGNEIPYVEIISKDGGKILIPRWKKIFSRSHALRGNVWRARAATKFSAIHGGWVPAFPAGMTWRAMFDLSVRIGNGLPCQGNRIISH
uniref:Uncharacterized protein n=1 Tax=Candidatus Kentrum sp. DK TaxID=2126562 RepID=A0A450SMH4_9GAMM|nr:MAG: hypothetical protein BECKDK2373C_GA0170839_104510 [Candidatus Kentron sp. DK]VFJ59716.1 MAG: hypothetical protein BECKDK2373B_GA0170837_108515 [Candidatus Kentron sp. DK]